MRGLLHARTLSDGGPFTRFACASCGVDTVVEERPDGETVLAPPEAVGAEAPGIAVALDGAFAREERRRARQWMERHGLALERLREERRRAAPVVAAHPFAEESAAPPPSPGRAPEPAPAPPPNRAPAIRDLPRSPAEARALLGVPEGAPEVEVDAAFRRASLRCHPDLVMHLDAEFQSLAHDKFLRLKRAHEILSRRK